MQTPRSQAGRSVPVRLTEVPLKVRRRFGDSLYEKAVLDRDLTLAAQLHAAVESPSDRIYWLPEKAVKKVLRPPSPPRLRKPRSR
jgi:hypothetical protein